MICSRYDKNVQSLCSGLLKNEKVIILPTDTVYGFSGIIEKTDSEIRKIKGRAETKPFIVLIAFPGDINEITDDEIIDLINEALQLSGMEDNVKVTFDSLVKKRAEEIEKAEEEAAALVGEDGFSEEDEEEEKPNPLEEPENVDAESLE